MPYEPIVPDGQHLGSSREFYGADAARFASRKWPEFEDLLSRAVASRAGQNVEFTIDDARRAIALLQRCVDAADGGGR